MNRRQLFATAAGFLAFSALPGAAAEDRSSLLDVARAMQAQDYVPNTTPLSPPFADLTYDAFRGIRPIAGKAAMIPHGDRFAYDLLPPGLYFPDPVAFDQVTPDGLRAIKFNPKLFSYQSRYFDEIPDESPGAGFTGLRLRNPVNLPDQMDEVMVMQGASYFRAIGQSMAYGLSARAVAIGTGGPKTEEFPRITHIRLHPAEGDAVRLEGVIDSPSLSGHIDMTVKPGVDTEMDVAVTLFPRVEIADIGIAPLTSMYLKGPMRSAVSDDFRPRVHDSDVFVIENGAGEVLWRPIANPRAVQTSAFADTSPRRFGLYQTPREYEAFEDSEARYHDRPSAFVEPVGDWGPGAVMLVEIPTGDEFLDNIVSFWRPDAALQPGKAYQFGYRLTWTRGAPETRGLATVLQSRSGKEHDRPGHRRFVVDIDARSEAPVPVISASDGVKIIGESAFSLPEGRGTRVTFMIEPEDRDTVELRLSLRDADGTQLSPVWLHRWTRARDGGV